MIYQTSDSHQQAWTSSYNTFEPFVLGPPIKLCRDLCGSICKVSYRAQTLITYTPLDDFPLEKPSTTTRSIGLRTAPRHSHINVTSRHIDSLEVLIKPGPLMVGISKRLLQEAPAFAPFTTSTMMNSGPRWHRHWSCGMLGLEVLKRNETWAGVYHSTADKWKLCVIGQCTVGRSGFTLNISLQRITTTDIEYDGCV